MKAKHKEFETINPTMSIADHLDVRRRKIKPDANTFPLFGQENVVLPSGEEVYSDRLKKDIAYEKVVPGSIIMKNPLSELPGGYSLLIKRRKGNVTRALHVKNPENYLMAVLARQNVKNPVIFCQIIESNEVIYENA